MCSVGRVRERETHLQKLEIQYNQLGNNLLRIHRFKCLDSRRKKTNGRVLLEGLYVNNIQNGSPST